MDGVELLLTRVHSHYGKNMTNKYLEKIARFDTSMLKHIAGGAALGAGVGSFSAEANILSNKVTEHKNSIYRYDDKAKKTARIVGPALGGLLGGATGFNLHQLKKEFDAGKAGGRAYGKYSGGYSHPPQKSHADHLKTFGANPSQFKTKKEAEKHFKTHLHRVHPDKHPGKPEMTTKFQELSTARDEIMKSRWFEKLARLLQEYNAKL